MFLAQNQWGARGREPQRAGNPCGDAGIQECERELQERCGRILFPNVLQDFCNFTLIDDECDVAHPLPALGPVHGIDFEDPADPSHPACKLCGPEVSERPD